MQPSGVHSPARVRSIQTLPLAARPGSLFAFGLYVDTTNGSLYITEDPTAGNRGGRGRAWVAPLVP